MGQGKCDVGSWMVILRGFCQWVSIGSDINGIILRETGIMEREYDLLWGISIQRLPIIDFFKGGDMVGPEC